MKKLILAVLMTTAAPLAAHAQYVKDFVEIDGARSNMLRGYGIVTGLAGLGDSPRGETARVLRNMLQNLVPPDAAVQNINSRNAALVLVTAELAPFQKQGTRIDVTVSAVGDARSLYGGELQIYFYTRLNASTKHLYPPYLVDGSHDQSERQQEFFGDMEKSKPRFFVAVNHPLSWVRKVGFDETIFEWYGDFTKQYHVIGVADWSYGAPTNYVWGDEAPDYILQGENQIILWEINVH